MQCTRAVSRQPGPVAPSRRCRGRESGPFQREWDGAHFPGSSFRILFCLGNSLPSLDSGYRNGGVNDALVRRL